MTAVLLQGARIVPVGDVPAPEGPCDVRVVGGVVTEVAPGLRPTGDDDVVRADGRWLVPGLWDQHVHLLQWAQLRSRVDVSRTPDPESVTRIVAGHVAGLADRQALVLGYGYRSATWRRPPTVAELDAVSGDTPVVLTSGDGHNGWLNSRALQLLGAPPRTGAIDEAEWFALVPRINALESASDGEAALRTAVAEAAARGVVGVVDLEMGPGFRDWPGRMTRGADLLRVRPAVYPDWLPEVLDAGLATGTPLLPGSELLTMGPLKIISDGSLNTRTAACCEPYADAGGSEFPHGKQNHPLPELVDLLGRAHAAGLETALHAIGDAAVATALDAFAATGAVGGIEHAQLVRRPDIARMAALGVRASVQPAHLLDDRDVTEQCWPDRADRCFPLRSMLDAGVTVVLGSDAPVSPLDPWLAMAAAVHRSDDDRPPWNPAEGLTAAEALAASTDGRGTVAAGSRGDLVLLDADPLAGDGSTATTAARLRAMQVALTVCAGRVTHRAL